VSLPRGWDETRGEWRVRLRDPKRFRRIRPKPFSGIKGVYIVGGPLKQGGPYVVQSLRFKKADWPSLTQAVGWFEASKFAGDQELENPPRRRRPTILTIPEQHQLRIAKQTLRMSDAGARIMGGMSKAEARAIIRRFLGAAAVAFYDAPQENPPERSAVGIRVASSSSSKASIRWSDGRVGRVSIGAAVDLVGTSRIQDALDHPGKWIVIGQLRDNPSIVDAIRAGDRVTIVDRFGQKRTGRAVMRSSHGGWVLNMGGAHGTPGIADESNIVKVSPKTRENPKRKGSARAERKTVPQDFWIESSTPEELAADPGSPYRMVTTGGQRFGLSVLDAIRAQKEGLEYRGRGTPPELEENPPRLRRGQLRVGAFRAGVEDSIEKLVRTETEISALMAQAFELQDRGEKVPEWIRERVRGLELERKAQLEGVKTAVERHGSVLEELTPATPARRSNPAGGDRGKAVELYRAFHGGLKPVSFHFAKIPDLSELVHLGRALRVDYQAARPRGSNNTPYRHEFAYGSELFTDRTGRALVILGNLKVSRAPRGRFGYIRAIVGA
jgi:hypothetical protein